MKSKTKLVLLAIFLGGFGAHRFYLGQKFNGFIYLLWCWSLIPFAVAIIEGIYFAAMRQEKFDAKYNPPAPVTWDPYYRKLNKVDRENCMMLEIDQMSKQEAKEYLEDLKAVYDYGEIPSRVYARLMCIKKGEKWLSEEEYKALHPYE